MIASFCLALNIFFEARNESLMGQLMVAEVTLNRVESSRYPDDVCAVVWQRKQFSWTHDGKHDDPTRMSYLDRKAWEQIVVLSEGVLNEEIDLPRNGATHYHASYVEPYWVSSMEYVGKVGKHVFYEEK